MEWRSSSVQNVAKPKLDAAHSAESKVLPTLALNAVSQDLKVDLMGKVAAVHKLIPESPDVSTEQIIEEIPKHVPEGVTISSMVVKPFAFGLSIIEVTSMMDDAEGLIEKLEDALRAVPNIQGVEADTITLI